MIRRFLILGVMLCVSLPVFAAEDAKVLTEIGLRESAVAMRDVKGWVKPTRIVVLADAPQRILFFEETVKGVELIPARNPREALEVIADADALVGFCQPNVVSKGPKIKWIHSQQAGVEDCFANPNVANGSVVLTNTQRINGPNVSEHAMALLLGLTRKINVAVVNQQTGRWDDRAMRSVFDLEGKTMMVVGLGGIGTDIAKRANAFGMKIIATRNTGREGPSFVSKVGLANELPAMIGEADVVVNATPLTKETTGLFNAAMFARMKKGAYFINVGRGESVLTEDLAAALTSGQLAGAGLDVVIPDPLPASNPIWKAGNIIITPHIGNFSEQRLERSWMVMRENMRRFVAGDKLLSVVDVKRGY